MIGYCSILHSVAEQLFWGFFSSVITANEILRSYTSKSGLYIKAHHMAILKELFFAVFLWIGVFCRSKTCRNRTAAFDSKGKQCVCVCQLCIIIGCLTALSADNSEVKGTFNELQFTWILSEWKILLLSLIIIITSIQIISLIGIF